MERQKIETINPSFKIDRYWRDIENIFGADITERIQ